MIWPFSCFNLTKRDSVRKYRCCIFTSFSCLLDPDSSWVYGSNFRACLLSFNYWNAVVRIPIIFWIESSQWQQPSYMNSIKKVIRIIVAVILCISQQARIILFAILAYDSEPWMGYLVVLLCFPMLYVKKAKPFDTIQNMESLTWWPWMLILPRLMFPRKTDSIGSEDDWIIPNCYILGSWFAPDDILLIFIWSFLLDLSFSVV